MPGSAPPRPHDRPSLFSAVLLVVGAGLAFSTSGPLARYAAPAHPLLIVFGRVSIAALILLGLDGTRAFHVVRALPARARLLVLAAGLVLAAHFALFVWGLSATSLPAALTLISLEPLSVVLWAFAVYGLVPNRPEWIGLVLSAIGAALVGAQGQVGEHRLIGDVLVAGAVILYGLYIAIARALRDALPVRTYAGLVYLAAAVFALGALLLGPSPPGAVRWPVPPHAALAIVLIALIPTLIGHTTVQAAARTAPPALVGLVSPMETVGGIAIGFALLSAVPTPIEIAGAIVIVAGVTVAVLGTRSGKPPAARSDRRTQES